MWKERLISRAKNFIMYNVKARHLFVMSRLIVMYMLYKRRESIKSVIFKNLENPDGLIIEHCGVLLKIDSSSIHDLTFVSLNGKNQIYEQEVIEFLKQNIKEDAVFVDAGANNGFFSLVASSLLKGTGAVYCFEPTPSTYKRLTRNIELNGYRNIKAYNLALGSKEYYRFIYISKIDDAGNSLVKTKGSSAKIPIKVVPLDEIVENQKVDIIKIDVEGFEKEVIAGAVNIINSNPDIKIIFEHNPDFLEPKTENKFTFLSQLGFRFFSMMVEGDHLVLKEIYVFDNLGFLNVLATRQSVNRSLSISL